MWTSRPSWWIYIGDANVLQLELRPAIRRATWNMLLGEIRIKISKKLKEENNNSNHQSFSVPFLTFEWLSFSHTICAEYQLWFIVVCVVACVTQCVDLYRLYLWDAVTVYWCWWCSGQGNLHHRPTSNTLATKTNNCKLDWLNYYRI